MERDLVSADQSVHHVASLGRLAFGEHQALGVRAGRWGGGAAGGRGGALAAALAAGAVERLLLRKILPARQPGPGPSIRQGDVRKHIVICSASIGGGLPMVSPMLDPLCRQVVPAVMHPCGLP